MDGHDGAPSRDALLEQSLHDRIAPRGNITLQTQHVGLIVVAASSWADGGLDPGEMLQRVGVSSGQIAASFQEASKPAELNDTYGGLHVRHAEVEANLI